MELAVDYAPCRSYPLGLSREKRGPWKKAKKKKQKQKSSKPHSLQREKCFYEEEAKGCQVKVVRLVAKSSDGP